MSTKTASTVLDDIGDMIERGELAEAKAALAKVAESPENRAELQFLRGYAKEMSLDRLGAVKEYEAVLAMDPDHTESAFRLGVLADQFGDDATAIAYYGKCIAHTPIHVSALINLAVLSEDRGDLDRAEDCLTDILDEFPNHVRARHFLKSVRSSQTMMYDEHSLKERERRSAILDMPISDFELSVRSRNCLRQMNIRTLGDLLRTTEFDLLSYKNFGETSLTEIKAVLAQKGLHLGQALEPAEKPAAATVPTLAPDAVAHGNKSVSELELSVRSRKALQRLGVSSVGDLTMRTEAELLSIKNFGQTSLTEIKEQLERFGLSLRKPGADIRLR
jgi:DNA-directed RNA polymerase subunit alpha